jgi:hypothetical protein
VSATQPSNESTNGSNSQEASSDQQEADAGSGELSDSEIGPSNKGKSRRN